MRRLTRLLLILLASTAIFASGTFYWMQFSGRQSGEQIILDERFSRRSVFAIEDREWLEFPIAGFHDRLRLFSFALVDGQRSQYIPDREFLYSIDYQILNEKSEVLLEKKYHMRSFFPDPILAENGQRLEPKFIPQQQAIPTAGRFFDVDLSTLEQPRKLRLKIGGQEPEMKKVLVRALFRGTLTADKARLRWARLSEEKKTKVTRQYIYPHSLLTEAEIESRLAQRWYPTTPSDTAYESHILYSYRTDDEELTFEDAPLRIGRSFGNDLLLTALLPKTESYRLFFQSANEDNLPPVEVTLRHWNPGPRVATEEIITLKPDSPVVERQLNKGMIELRAPAALRVAITSEQVERQHINTVFSLNSYALSQDEAVLYRVSTNTQQASDFRVNVRLAMGYSGLSGDQTIHTPADFTSATAPRYEVLDRKGQILSKGKLNPNSVLSPYGQLVGHAARYKISEPQSLYFRLPPDAYQVAFYGSPSQFVYAYTRPATLPLSRVVPRDYRSWEHLGGRAPSWFLLTPENDLDLALNARRHRLYSQPQPPQIDEQIAAGFFSIREIQPRGDNWGKYIIASLTYDAQPRTGADKLFFSRLTPDANVHLRAPPGITRVAPSLLFQRHSEAPESVAIRVDDQLLGHYPVSGRAGLIRLPPLAAGSHSFSISGDTDTRWHINQCECRYTHQRRFAYKLLNNSIEFDIHKTSGEDEVLTLLVFTDSQGARADINTELIGFRRSLTPSEGWTFPRINFQVRPDLAGEDGFELDFSASPIGNPERMFIPLGADVPPGHYRLRLRQTGGPEALVQLYKLEATAGVSRFFTELL